ncbi:MAG: DUF3526 domain-containing protein [Bryobacterales bacterium]|nr:DUF3526 domain-containing protein [Bryobacterales bacterium]
MLWGKCLGIVAALCLLLIPATAAGAWVLTMGVAAPGDSSFPRFLAMGGAYAVYLLAIVALALGVSARAASSRVALLVLVGFWIANSLLVPRVAASVAEALHPTPSLQEFLKQVHLDLESGIDGHRPPGEREAELKQALMKKYNVTSEKDLPLNLSGYFLQQSEEFGNEIFEKRFGELSDTYGRQQLVLRAAAGVSPMLAARAFSMGMAGTDLWHHRQFAAAAEQYRRNWVKRLNDDLTYQSRTGDTSYKVGRPFWEATQDFVYQSEPFGAAASAQAWSLGILLAWLAGSTAFAFLAIRRLSGQVA